MQLGLCIGVAAELETGWNLDTNSKRDRCSNELRIANVRNPPCPLFLKLQNRDTGKSVQLESPESTVITTRSHLTFVVRECFEQMHRGDHFIFAHPSNASTWNELCAQPNVFRVEGPMCRWHLLSGEYGFLRELVLWLTNHPHLAQALEQWRENASGTEPRKNRLASARYPVELLEADTRHVAMVLRDPGLENRLPL